MYIYDQIKRVEFVAIYILASIYDSVSECVIVAEQKGDSTL